ncbi:hypothetical protein N7512_007831 [Penicillium capsulatum]|nr:hypothetical protein N7512_007831 [Penicillium capsulatum]
MDMLRALDVIESQIDEELREIRAHKAAKAIDEDPIGPPARIETYPLVKSPKPDVSGSGPEFGGLAHEIASTKPGFCLPKASAVPRTYLSSSRNVSGFTAVNIYSREKSHRETVWACQTVGVLGSTYDMPIIISSDDEDEVELILEGHNCEGEVSEAVRRAEDGLRTRSLKRKHNESSDRADLSSDENSLALLTPRGRTFPGAVYQSRDKRLGLSMEHKQPPGIHPFFTDGSVVGHCAAASVVWKNMAKNKWQGQGFESLHLPADSETTEIFAVAKAFELATEHIKSVMLAAGPAAAAQKCVLVFSDSGAALTRIDKYEMSTGVGAYAKRQKGIGIPRFKDVLDLVMINARTLRVLDTKIELHLVPGHSKVPGNVQADRLANRTASLMANRMARSARFSSTAKKFSHHRRHDNRAAFATQPLEPSQRPEPNQLPEFIPLLEPSQLLESAGPEMS